MSLLLVDDQGEVWDGQSRKLRHAFDSPYSGGEFSEYAVANLGFVALNTYGTSCQVRLRPATVSDRTFRSVCNWLHTSRSERVVLTWLDDDWTNELLRAGETITNRLEELITGAKRAKPSDFLSRRIDTPELGPHSPLGEIARQWPDLSAPSGQHALMHLLRAALGDRYIVVKKQADVGKLVYQEFGEGLFGYYETWRHCAVGAPMEEMPDRAYGKLAAQAYYETMENKTPRIERVDALMRWPHAGRARLRYQRVIVPVSDRSGATVLIGGSILDPRIDLRVRSR